MDRTPKDVEQVLRTIIQSAEDGLLYLRQLQEQEKEQARKLRP